MQEQERKPLTRQEWEQFRKQAHEVFQRLPQDQRLKEWAWLGEPLWEEATEKRCIGVLSLLIQFAGAAQSMRQARAQQL
ncbi:MAG: hypothetical protein J6T92_01015 [Ottowia sp.]|nr:hypothetical protein [Ottowia sp.]